MLARIIMVLGWNKMALRSHVVVQMLRHESEDSIATLSRGPIAKKRGRRSAHVFKSAARQLSCDRHCRPHRLAQAASYSHTVASSRLHDRPPCARRVGVRSSGWPSGDKAHDRVVGVGDRRLNLAESTLLTPTAVVTPLDTPEA